MQADSPDAGLIGWAEHAEDGSLTTWHSRESVGKVCTLCKSEISAFRLFGGS